jgi:hypothetical protein
VSPTIRQALALLALGGSLLACGPREGSVTLRLVRAPFEDPFQGADQLRVRVVDPDQVVLRELTTTAPGAGRVELGLIGPGEQRWEVQALAAGKVLARGWSRLLAPAADLALAERVPFSTARVAVALPAELALDGPISVDGQSAWRSSPSLILDEASRVLGPPVAAPDLRAELQLAWNATTLAFKLTVRDDCPALRAGEPAGSCGASLEPDRVALGFDLGDDGGVVYGPGDLWLEVRATSVTVLRGQLAREDFPVAFALADDGRGYTVEGALRSSAFKQGYPTQPLGLEVQVVDHDPGQSEPSVLRFSGATGDPATPTPPEAMGRLGLAQVSP